MTCISQLHMLEGHAPLWKKSAVMLAPSLLSAEDTCDSGSRESGWHSQQGDTRSCSRPFMRDSMRGTCICNASSRLPGTIAVEKWSASLVDVSVRGKTTYFRSKESNAFHIPRGSLCASAHHSLSSLQAGLVIRGCLQALRAGSAGAIDDHASASSDGARTVCVRGTECRVWRRRTGRLRVMEGWTRD